MKEKLEDKALGDLIEGMMDLATKNPGVTDPNCQGEKRKLYEAYKEEISRREKEIYKYGIYARGLRPIK